jgi:DNA-binding transcriptional LysR family regulator
LQITFEQIYAFKAVAEWNSFSIAAEKIFRTQSAISIQIARLEDNVGEKLLYRTTKHVELTEAGRVVLNYCKKIVDNLEQLHSELEDLDQTVKGKLVLSTSDTTACYRLPDILQKYNKTYPDVEIIIRNSTSLKTVELVKQNEVDLGIVTLSNISSDMKTIPLFSRSDIVVCNKDHSLAKRETVFLKDLENYHCILLDQNCATRRIIDKKCVYSNITLNIIMELSSVEVIKQFVKINAGISIVPEAAVKKEIKDEELVGIKINDYINTKQSDMGIVYKKNKYLSNASKSFIEILTSKHI